MSSAPPDDDEELELEPVDPEVLAHERARSAAHTERVIKNVNVDELYDDEPGRYSDLGVDISHLRQFRFTTRHLLIVTALLAMALTLFQLFPRGLALFLIAVAFVAAGYFWVYREERRIQRERERRREAFHAASARGGQVAAFEGDEEAADSSGSPFEFKFTFSLKQLVITITVAAVIVGLIQFMGGPGPLAVILGTIAFMGLVFHAAGFDPPPAVILAWWLLLLAYLVMGVIASLSSDAAATPLAMTLVDAYSPTWRSAA